MNTIDKTIRDFVFMYIKKNDWLTYDGTFFNVNQEKVDLSDFKKHSDLTYQQAMDCIKIFVRKENFLKGISEKNLDDEWDDFE